MHLILNMGKSAKTFAIIFLVFIFLFVFIQNTQALGPYITLNSTEITETTVTFFWTQPDFFATSYTLYMSTASNYGNGHPFTPIWSTSDRNQTTTTVSNLTPSSDYYFYIIASGGGGGVSSNLLEVQTLPKPTPSPTITPSPVPTPFVPEFPLLTTTLLLLIIMVAAGLLVYHRRKPDKH